MDILRIATAGSVDDGKSTLIGRLLYDTRSITKDKLDAIEGTSKRKGLDFVDLSLLTDGLIAEREQGITIDVAHIYFSTASRKYIIADTPGHVEYTRNMITGASNCEVSIVLIDARNGVIEQTRRHLFISSILKIGTIFVCINKMDLIEFDVKVFDAISEEVKSLAVKMGYEGVIEFIPIVAKDGDHIVDRSKNMMWYKGKTLLEHLEQTNPHKKDDELPARLPIQYVIRPHSAAFHDFRGYAGKLSSGKINVGDEVVVLPSLKRSTVKKILHSRKEVLSAGAGDSICIELNEDIDVSRGNMIVKADGDFTQANSFVATIAWMEEKLMVPGNNFILQHGTNQVKSKIISILNKLDMETMNESNNIQQFGLNDIGNVTIKTAKPVFVDIYKNNPGNGTFILIDEFSNNTVAVGFIRSI